MVKLNKKFSLKLAVTAFVLIAAVGTFSYFRPLPALTYTTKNIPVNTGAPTALPWPNYGQSAFGAVNYGILAASGNQKPASIASVAKVFTALAVLKQKPLEIGQQGPLITIDSTDLGYFNYYYANDGSVAKVAVGEQISEYQALQAMMLPSANNVADTLARWAFGSMDAYNAYANNMAKDLGLTQTIVDGASGFNDKTISTGIDLVKAGLAAVQNPVFAEIVKQQSATIPVAGEIRNVNWLLGTDNVNGIKTGNTDIAGGCFLFSSTRTVDGKNITAVGAVMGAPDRNTAIKDSRPIITSSDKNFTAFQSVVKNQIVGKYTAAWGAKANAVADADVNIQIWKGQEVSTKVSLSSLSGPQAKGAKVGTILVSSNGQKIEINAALETAIPKPSIWWRIFRH